MVVMPNLPPPPYAVAPAGGRPAPDTTDTLVNAVWAARLHPAAQALLDLYVANRLEGERIGQCFARLGAPTYAAILREALFERTPDAPDDGPAATA